MYKDKMGHWKLAIPAHKFLGILGDRGMHDTIHITYISNFHTVLRFDFVKKISQYNFEKSVNFV